MISGIKKQNQAILRGSPYSPELNPVENIWQYLRKSRLSSRIFQGVEHVIDAACEASNWLTKQPDKITSIATRKWATL